MIKHLLNIENSMFLYNLIYLSNRILTCPIKGLILKLQVN